MSAFSFILRRCKPAEEEGWEIITRNPREAPGRAMQVDPIKITLKVPGTKRLTLSYNTLLSNVAFKFNVRSRQGRRRGCRELLLRTR